MLASILPLVIDTGSLVGHIGLLPWSLSLAYAWLIRHITSLAHVIALPSLRHYGIGQPYNHWSSRHWSLRHLLAIGIITGIGHYAFIGHVNITPLSLPLLVIGIG